MTYIEDSTFSGLYSKTLERLNSNPDYVVSPRGKVINECTNATLLLTNPSSNLFMNKERKNIFKYLAGEFLWYLLGRNDLAFIEKYSKFWHKIANPDNTLNSAYGYLIFKKTNAHGYSEWRWAMESLLNDIDSRQAIMHFNCSDHLYLENKDQVCTIYVQFIIRNNALNLHAYMRSNDLIKGTTYDIPFFALLQSIAHKILQREKYPSLKIGHLFHNVTSLHIYESDFELIDKMLDSEFYEHRLPAIDKIPIRIDGSSIEELNMVIEKKYDGNDTFLQWLQENS